MDGRARLKEAYTNAAREGRTKPGLIEMRDRPDQPDISPNRRDYRYAGFKGKKGGPRVYPKSQRRIGNKIASAARRQLADRKVAMDDVQGKAF